MAVGARTPSGVTSMRSAGTASRREISSAPAFEIANTRSAWRSSCSTVRRSVRCQPASPPHSRGARSQIASSSETTLATPGTIAGPRFAGLCSTSTRRAAASSGSAANWNARFARPFARPTGQRTQRTACAHGSACRSSGASRETNTWISVEGSAASRAPGSSRA